MLNNITKKSIIIMLLCFISFLRCGCIYLSESNNTIAVIEVFNATWLNRSPYYSFAMEELDKELGRNKVIFINYYVQSTDDHPFPRLSCDESENRMKYYMEDGGLPTAFFNGGEYMKGLPGGDNESRLEALKKILIEKISKINSISTPIRLSGACFTEEKDSYLLELKIEALEDITFNNLQLFYALTENNIPFATITGDKIHHFVFREFLRSRDEKDKIALTGIPLKLSKKGDKFETTLSFDINSELYINELNVVVFVQDFTSKLILQGIEIPIRNGYR